MDHSCLVGRAGAHHRADVQGLRALAVSLVVLAHADVPWLPGGFLGVDVFFVISGFVITGAILREADLTGKVLLSGFYARRARRILPAATLVLVVTLICAGGRLPAVGVERLASDARWAAMFLANVHFAAVHTDYWSATREPSLLQHYWSLSVEEQFYLVWPVAVAGLLALRRRLPGHRRSAPDASAILAPLAVLAWAASFVWSVRLTPRSPTAAYFSTPVRAWELATGVLVALGARAISRRLTSPYACGAVQVGGLCAILAAAASYDAQTPLPGWRALLPVLGTAAVLAAPTTSPSRLLVPMRLLTARPTTWLGDASYSVYLWHWPVFLLVVPDHSSPTRLAGAVAVVLGLSALSYHLVENPARRSRRALRGRRGLALWPAMLATVALVTATAGTGASASLAERRHLQAETYGLRHSPTPSSATSARVHREGPTASAHSHGRRPDIPALVARATEEARAGAPIPYPLVNQRRLGSDLWHLVYRCSSVPGTTSHRICPVPVPRAPMTLAVYGDSHAGMWIPALSRLARRHGFRVVPFIKWGCGPYLTPLGPATGDECARYHVWALDHLRRLRPDAVVVSARVSEMAPVPARPGAETLLRRLARLTRSVAVVSDVTDLPFDPAECVTDPDAIQRTCTATLDADVIATNRLLRGVAAGAGARFVDVTPLLCHRRLCPTVVDGVVTYGDYNHLSVTWARRLAPELGRLLHLDPVVLDGP